VICAYTEARWDLLVRAVGSVFRQAVRPAEIVIVIDHCPALLRRARRDLAELAESDDGCRLTIVENTGERGLSDARNTGLRYAGGEIAAFLDDDAEADDLWLSYLCAHYRDPSVIGVGGRVVPQWERGRPAWFPTEFDWVVGCTYRGLPEELAPIRNLMGANMSFRRDAVMGVGGFSPALGRVGSTPVGCEETELCIRLTSRGADVSLLYEPQATVQHHVPSSRATWGYFRSRCYAEGLSKAEVRARTGPREALRSERAYLVSTVPSGVARALAEGCRGRPAGATRAAALAAGVATTIAGYVAGRMGRTPPVPPAGPEVSERRATAVALAAVAALPVAWLLVGISLRHVHLAGMGDLGLVSVLPVGFWAGLAVLAAGFGLAVTRRRLSPPLLCAYVVSLVLVLHGTPAVLYGTLRYAWAWKHVGVIDYLARHGATDPHLGGDLAAYQSWPGFFAGNLLLIKVIGVRSALSYASWAPAFFDLLVLAPLYLIFRRFSQDQRLIWTALWLFCLGNWVGQDYFSPQAAAYFLYLVVLAVGLRWYSSSGVAAADAQVPATTPPRDQRAQRAVMLGALALVVAAIASSHQLTPLMLVTAVAGLVLCRRCSERFLLVVAVLLTGGWIVLVARSFLAANLHSIAASVGHPGGNTQANLLNLSHASRGQVLVADLDRLLSAAVWLLAAIGVWRRRHGLRADLPLLVLALTPLPLIVANSYGGEMVFRVYLFALPFVAFLAAASLFPSERSGRSRLFPVAVIGVSVALLIGFLFSYYGEEQVNYFSPREVAATSWLYSHAPASSMIIGPTGDLPWGEKNAELYRHYWFALDAPRGREQVLANPVQALCDDLTDPRHPAAFLVFTRAQAAEVDTTGLLPPGAIARIEAAVVSSGRFRVVYRNADATIAVAVDRPASVTPVPKP
jgi:GT2 family glycosyltransferase